VNHFTPLKFLCGKRVHLINIVKKIMRLRASEPRNFIDRGNPVERLKRSTAHSW
jgi:hypothetical protein